MAYGAAQTGRYPRINATKQQVVEAGDARVPVRAEEKSAEVAFSACFHTGACPEGRGSRNVTAWLVLSGAKCPSRESFLMLV